MRGRNPRPKSLTSSRILLAEVFMLLFSWTQEATAGTQLPTSVVASAGGEATSTNFAMKSTLGQSTPIGPSTSTNFEVGAGFWYQDPVAPLAIGDLTATLSISDIALEWSHAADNVAIDHYVVYRGTDPRFELTSGDSIYGTTGTSYLDPGAAGTVGTNYFYVVKATDPSSNRADDSNRVGEFDSQMLNGTK